MALPVVVPVAKALAPPAAAKAGAVLRGLIRNGPTLLRMVDQFRAPPSLGPQVADTPRRDRVRDLVADAIAGAQLGVASLPNPMQPQGPGGEWLRFALANLAPFPAAGTLARLAAQFWGQQNADIKPEPGKGFEDVELDLGSNPQPITINYYTHSLAEQTGCSPQAGDISRDNLENRTFTPEGGPVSSLSISGGGSSTVSAGCGEAMNDQDPPRLRVNISYESGESEERGLAGINLISVASFRAGFATWETGVISITGGQGQTLYTPPPEFGGDRTRKVPIDFSGLPSAGPVPMPAAVPAVAAAIAQAEAAGANPLPPAGAVTVPSNPPANWFAGLGSSGVPAVPGSTPGTLPGQVPTVQPLPAFVPRPVPGPSPAETQPETQPQVAPTTRPTTTPTTPATTPGAVPVPGPAGQPLTDAGTVPAPVQLPIPTTDPNFHFPVPGAPPVTGVQVRPDLKNIAKEVGRLEQKAARMLENQSDAEGKPFDLSELLRLLRLIWELLSGQRDGGEYAAIGVCEVDINGNLLEDQPVIPVPFAGAGNPMDAVSAKVDAIAQLLQEHKQLRQPICRPPKAQGQPVTVVFEDLGNG